MTESMIGRVALALVQARELTPHQRARAAIEAMRMPTEAMVVAGCRHENMGDMAGRWEAMIDKALQDGKAHEADD